MRGFFKNLGIIPPISLLFDAWKFVWVKKASSMKLRIVSLKKDLFESRKAFPGNFFKISPRVLKVLTLRSYNSFLSKAWKTTYKKSENFFENLESPISSFVDIWISFYEQFEKLSLRHWKLFKACKASSQKLLPGNLERTHSIAKERLLFKILKRFSSSAWIASSNEL